MMLRFKGKAMNVQYHGAWLEPQQIVDVPDQDVAALVATPFFETIEEAPKKKASKKVED